MGFSLRPHPRPPQAARWDSQTESEFQLMPPCDHGRREVRSFLQRLRLPSEVQLAHEPRGMVSHSVPEDFEDGCVDAVEHEGFFTAADWACDSGSR